MKKTSRSSLPSRNLPGIIEALARFHGPPRVPQPVEPFQMILWENVAYLVDDERRAAAFEALRAEVGLTPERILRAPAATLREVAALGGMHPEARVEKLRRIAKIASEAFGGDLSKALELPAAKAAFRKFPGIGEPSAEKILLFNRVAPVLALESNGLRVLLRLGFGKEEKSYAATYRGVQEAVGDSLGRDCARLTRVHQVLRAHGQELCRRSAPLCEACPVAPECEFYARVRSSGR